jgi:hypothetical protein
MDALRREVRFCFCWGIFFSNLKLILHFPWLLKTMDLVCICMVLIYLLEWGREWLPRQFRQIELLYANFCK